MQQGNEYNPSYYAHQYASSFTSLNPNPGEFPSSTPIQSSYASAPPYSHYSAPEYTAASYPPYPHNPDIPPSAPSYSNPQPQNLPQSPQFTSFPPYNPSPYQPDPAPAPAPAPAPYSLPQQPSSAPYYPYDSHQPPAVNYSHHANPNPNLGSSAYPSYENPYESSAARLDQGGAYFNDNSGRYGPGVTGGYNRSSSGYEEDLYGKKPESGLRYDQVGVQDDGLGEGVYAYDGGRSEPYGARGTTGSRSSALFDDYGRSISSSLDRKEQGASKAKVVRAVPKVDVQQDVKNGVQKFRVKLLAETYGQSTMDVLCQIGLDGIRMLDPSTNRTLRIYPLENVTRCEVVDSSILAFWSKSSVDVEPRRIRLQSNSYTTSTLLDTVTAATVQFKEMGGNSLSRGKGAADAGKPSEQPNEKKKGFDWMNLIKPINEEKDHWVPDEAVNKCTSCGGDFGAFNRRHHCRNCGDIFCDKCTQGRIALTADENAQPVRVCDRCMAEVSHRLSIAKEAASKPATLHSHEDLAKKLQEEMEKNRKSSSGLKTSDRSSKRMREVACPVCTVHLQVQVPTSGSETIECGVCQHPFLVSAH
ncbi:protein FREE1-like [Typha latifolia]|uniref:protein FREE1-like n=1 Tax=Typha latifolia TaxID=4733 RepID=UPI003C2BC221